MDGPLSIRRGPHPTSARLQVYARIRDAIVAHELAPGARIQDLKLAADLGVSRTPVREALLQLAGEGLVEMLPQHGTYVARISVAAVREAQFIREALELAAIREAVDRLDDAQLVAIEANLEAQRRTGGDGGRFYLLDEEFHRLLLQASGHAGVARVADQSRAHLDRVRRLSLPSELVTNELIPQHAAIVHRLRARDGDGAEAALRDHLRLILRDLPELQRQHPDFFLADEDDAAPVALGSS